MEERTEFEQELRQAMERRPAPPSLKRKIMAARRAEAAPHKSAFVWWQRLAAAFALTAVLGGYAEWRHQEERRKGEAAREQVLTALRITSHALNQMNQQLAARGRGQD
jgi:hypothetical protein